MKLEAGKRYVRRDGTVTPPLVVDLWTEGFLQDPETEFIFDSRDEELGDCVFVSEKNPKDLVAPYEGHGEAP